jgi:hypothetical protein
MNDFGAWFGLLELPFLFTAVFFAFRTASALRGGALGTGMNLMAWGFLVMGIGHLHMGADRILHYNLLANVFGSRAGALVWILALVLTWALSGLGFYHIYKVSKT